MNDWRNQGAEGHTEPGSVLGSPPGEGVWEGVLVEEGEGCVQEAGEGAQPLGRARWGWSQAGH